MSPRSRKRSRGASGLRLLCALVVASGDGRCQLCADPASTWQHAAGRRGLAEDGTPRLTYRPWLLRTCDRCNDGCENDSAIKAEAKALGFLLARNGDPYRFLDPTRRSEWLVIPNLEVVA